MLLGRAVIARAHGAMVRHCGSLTLASKGKLIGHTHDASEITREMKCRNLRCFTFEDFPLMFVHCEHVELPRTSLRVPKAPPGTGDVFHAQMMLPLLGERTDDGRAVLLLRAKI